MADAPFRLLHLPPELQLMVYQKYFEGSELTITEYSHETEVFVFRDLPSLNLELVSRNVSLDARSLRDRCTSRDLRVEYPDFIKSHLGKFIGDKRYAWVRGHIEALLIDEATYSLNAARVPLELQPDWQTLVVRCSRLTEVVIRFREHRVVVTVPAVASATNKLRKKALREVMRHALDGNTQVDDLHETTIKAYQLPDLAQRLESLDRDGWVSVDFPSCWHTNNDGILFFMSADCAVRPEGSQAHLKRCFCRTFTGYWSDGMGYPVINAASIEEKALMSRWAKDRKMKVA